MAARASAGTSRNTSDRLVELYLDMLAAERGAGKNTLDAYARDLRDLSQYLSRSGKSAQRATTEDLRKFLGDNFRAKTFSAHRWRANSRRCGSFSGSSMPKGIAPTIPPR